MISRYTIGLPYFNLRTMVQPQIRIVPNQLESNAYIPSVRLPRDELPTVIEVYGNGLLKYCSASNNDYNGIFFQLIWLDEYMTTN